MKPGNFIFRLMVLCYRLRESPSIVHASLSQPPRLTRVKELGDMLFGQAPQYLLDVCQPVSDVASSPICWSATAERTAPEAGYICRAGFLCGWSIGAELVTGLPERPGSQQRHFLQAPKDVFVCSVLTYVQRIRGFTTMRYINLRFT